MINLVIALSLWGQYWSHCYVRIFCNNEAVVQVVKTSKTRDLFVAVCVRNIWLISAIKDIKLDIHHIMETKNTTADLLSRLHSTSPVNQKLLQNILDNGILDSLIQINSSLDNMLAFPPSPPHN